MGEIPKVHYWRRKRVEELSREELLEVIEYLAKRLAEYTEPQAMRARSLGLVEMMKRGEDTGVRPMSN